ncbi:Two pore calcium channel protein 1 [Citrus sinensis]|nr:Two pore calcium channel protein 1 [Citrus sinensis]
MAKFESMEFNIFELVLINLDEFADLCNAIALRFQKEDVPSCFENLPSIYHSPFSEKLKAFIRSTKFGYMISIILIVNLVAVIVETTLDIQESSLQSVWQEVEFVFDDFYTFAVIGETITLASPNGQTFLSNGEWIRYLLLARMLRLIRLLMHVQQYRGFVATFLTLIPSLMPYLGTIFCVQCIYCSLGVQVIAFVLEAFFAEMELESSEKCEEEDKDGEPRERRRRVGTKTRSQRVDVLLHHMLSAELQKSCDS